MIDVKAPYTQPEDITVQWRSPEGELEECNHAGAEEKSMEFTTYSSYDGGAYTAPDDSHTEYVLVCDKCGQWYDELNREWRDQ